MPANLENSAVATGLEKVSFHSSPKERQCQGNVQSYCTIALISFASKVIVKILQARLQQCMNCELPDVQAGFRKGREMKSNCQHPLDHQKSKSSRKKKFISALLTLPKPLTVWITTNCGNFFKNGNTKPPDLPLEKSV